MKAVNVFRGKRNRVDSTKEKLIGKADMPLWTWHTRNLSATHLSVSSSKSHVCFASRCLGRSLSTWQMTSASCPTEFGALCHQLTFRLAWCCEHSAVTTTELLQSLDLACGTLFQSSCTIQNCSDDSWRDTFFGKHERGTLWLLICSALEKHLLTYLLIYKQSNKQRKILCWDDTTDIIEWKYCAMKAPVPTI